MHAHLFTRKIKQSYIVPSFENRKTSHSLLTTAKIIHILQTNTQQLYITHPHNKQPRIFDYIMHSKNI